MSNIRIIKLNNSNIVSQNKSFSTEPIQKNLSKIMNMDNIISLNKSHNFESNKIKSINNFQAHNEKKDYHYLHQVKEMKI